MTYRAGKIRGEGESLALGFPSGDYEPWHIACDISEGEGLAS
jgi:hypothetical protein